MAFRHASTFCLVFSLATCASAQERDPATYIFRTFNARFHCGGKWYDFQLTISPATGLLGTIDPDAGIVAQINVMFYRSPTRMDPAAYMLTGPYDRKTGHFRLEPKQWNTDNHPSGFQMVGMEGKFDSATETIAAKMLGSACDSVEIGQGGRALPPLPAPPPNRAAEDPNRPEMRLTPSNVTNYLDVAAGSPDFEYWVTAWSDPEGTVHEGGPIDEAVERMKGDKWACVGSQRVTWDASGLKGTATDGIGVTERYVIECVGDCKGVFYRPWIGANVTHFGLSAPLPTFQIKSMRFGGMSFEWRFSRKKNTQPPPEIYVHRWTPLVGWGPFDPVPAEIARRQATAPPCRAPKR